MRYQHNRLTASLSDKSRRWPIAFGLFAVLAAPLAAQPAKEEVRSQREEFTSARKVIAVERFEPAGPGKYPAIVFLHPLDGLETAYANIYRSNARDFAARGYVVVLPHYFDRTGATEAEVKANRGKFLPFAKGAIISEPDRKEMEEHFSAWSETVCDAVAYTRGLANVKAERVGLVGCSLGGFLALSVAAREDQKIAAVVDFFGGLPEDKRAKVKKLPPVLVLHGDEDTVVSVKEAQALQTMLDARQLEGVVQIYPGVGHMFLDAKGGISLKAFPALCDANGRTIAFLAKYLQRESTAKTAPLGNLLPASVTTVSP
jgi:carboxymethylenebutenolidase